MTTGNSWRYVLLPPCANIEKVTRTPARIECVNVLGCTSAKENEHERVSEKSEREEVVRAVAFWYSAGMKGRRRYHAAYFSILHSAFKAQSQPPRAELSCRVVYIACRGALWRFFYRLFCRLRAFFADHQTCRVIRGFSTVILARADLTSTIERSLHDTRTDACGCELLWRGGGGKGTLMPRSLRERHTLGDKSPGRLIFLPCAFSFFLSRFAQVIIFADRESRRLEELILIGGYTELY